MKTDFAKTLIQHGYKEFEVSTAKIQKPIAIKGKRQKLKNQLTVAEFWNIERNRKVFGRRRYLTD